MDNETFRRICARAADEEDPNILKLLKNRMRMLLSVEKVENDPNHDEVGKVK
jgi:hypothetical protein